MDSQQSAWMTLFMRFRRFKAARCEKVTLKSVDWYLLPLICDMEERMARRKQAGT